MEISVWLINRNFDLKIDIITYPSYLPATFNHPAEGEDTEYKIKNVTLSLNLFDYMTFGEWNLMDSEDQDYYIEGHEKIDELKCNSISDEENEIILEAIDNEISYYS